VDAKLDGVPATNGQVVKLYLLPAGTTHTLAITAMDKAYNTANAYVTFSIETSIQSMMSVVTNLYTDKLITSANVYKGLMETLKVASQSKKPEFTSVTLQAFIWQVKVQSGKRITTQAADLLIADANWLITHLADATPPYIKIQAPRPVSYPHTGILRIDFEVLDTITGVKEVNATLDGVPVIDNQKVDLRTLVLGEHIFSVSAVDHAGNTAARSVTFRVVVTIQSLKSSVEGFYREGKIDSRSVYRDLMNRLESAEHSHKPWQVVSALNSFIQKVQQQSGNHIATEAADQLITEAQWLIDYMK